MIRILLLIFLLPLFCKAQSVKNLDIKNGFLRFKLGDSTSTYKSLVHNPDNSIPKRYEVKSKAIGLKHRIDKLTLIAENGIITEIEVLMQGEPQVQFMQDAMKKAYGEGYILSGKDTLPDRHATYTVWIGKRVSALAKKQKTDLPTVNKGPLGISFERLLLKKTSDLKMDGELSPDFPL